ncbi:MAG: sigma-70 family RNA polymerase sigma factor [Steroidobacteraceae bacterium]
MTPEVANSQWRERVALSLPERRPTRRRSKPACTLQPLLAQIAAGHEESLAALYRQTVARLQAISGEILQSRHDAEEVARDVLIYVWLNSHRYDACRGSVMAWLAMMTRSRSIDRLRKRANTIFLENLHVVSAGAEPGPHTPAPEHAVANIQQHTHLHRTLAQLPSLPRELITLSFLRGLRHEEIAAAVGLPLGTVKSNIRRGLMAMRSRLEGSLR